MILPWKNIVLFFLGIGMIFSISTQPWELINSGKVGVLDIRLITVKFISVIFWTVYAFLVGAKALQFINPIVLILFGSTIVLYYICLTMEALHRILKIQGLE